MIECVDVTEKYELREFGFKYFKCGVALVRIKSAFIGVPKLLEFVSGIEFGEKACRGCNPVSASEVASRLSPFFEFFSDYTGNSFKAFFRGQKCRWEVEILTELSYKSNTLMVRGECGRRRKVESVRITYPFADADTASSILYALFSFMLDGEAMVRD